MKSRLLNDVVSNDTVSASKSLSISSISSIQQVRISDMRDTEYGNESISSNEYHSLWDCIKDDVMIVSLLRSTGFFLKDVDSKSPIIIALYIWLIILFSCSLIGFSWYFFYFGSLAIYKFFSNLDKDVTSLINNSGNVLFNVVVPPLQAVGIGFSLYKANKLIYVKSAINNDPNSINIIKTCKRDTMRFFIVNSILVIALFPLDVIAKYHDDDDSFKNYTLYVVDAVFSSLFYYFLMVTWLSASMFCTSISMQQTQLLQQELLKKLKSKVCEVRISNYDDGSIISTDNNTTELEMKSYLVLHREITSRIQSTFYSVQYVTVGALVNIITFIWLIWSENISKHKATMINSLDDQFRLHLALNAHAHQSKEVQFELMQIQLHSISLPISFRLLFYRLSRRELQAAFISFLLFIFYLFIRILLIID